MRIGEIGDLGLAPADVNKLLSDMVGVPGAQTIVQGMSVPERLTFLQTQIAALPIADTATLVAGVLGAQFKQASYGQFVAALKTALLKV